MEEVNQPESNTSQPEANSSPAEESSSADSSSAAANPPLERRADETDRNRRKSVVDRRTGIDRRQVEADPDELAIERRAGAERRSNTGLERRRGPGRRRSDERRSAEEGEMTVEQFEFCMAIETYKKVNRRLFPTWTEVLEVITQLGYRKVCSRTIKLENCPEPTLIKIPA
jgi:hypothetical protein